MTFDLIILWIVVEAQNRLLLYLTSLKLLQKPINDNNTTRPNRRQTYKKEGLNKETNIQKIIFNIH